MKIEPDKLRKEVAGFERRREELIAQANECNGAIKILRAVIALLESPPDNPAAPAQSAPPGEG
jgi:hypothetical protein